MDESRAVPDDIARRTLALLPAGRLVGILGSTECHDQDSAATCERLGECLADLGSIVLLTGGVPGIGEAVGRAFDRARRRGGRESDVFHILPHGFAAPDYGHTLHAGFSMHERREILARMSDLYVVIEGGPGTEHEARVAAERGALVLPVGRSGGHARVLQSRSVRPEPVPETTWSLLADPSASAGAVAEAISRFVATLD